MQRIRWSGQRASATPPHGQTGETRLAIVRDRARTVTDEVRITSLFQPGPPPRGRLLGTTTENLSAAWRLPRHSTGGKVHRSHSQDNQISAPATVENSAQFYSEGD